MPKRREGKPTVEASPLAGMLYFPSALIVDQLPAGLASVGHVPGVYRVPVAVPRFFDFVYCTCVVVTADTILCVRLLCECSRCSQLTSIQLRADFFDFM